MSNITLLTVDNWPAARAVYPDYPVVLLWVFDTVNKPYMRYRGEFYLVDDYSYVSFSNQFWWCIAGVWFDHNSIAWMLNNSIDYPFSREDFVLYQLTWGDIRD